MINVLTKQDASDLGLTRYRTGKPCKYGHVDERLISNDACVTCQSARKTARSQTRAFKDQRNANEVAKRAAVHPQTLARIAVRHTAVVERNAAHALGVTQRREARKRICEAKRQTALDEREAKKQAARDAKTKIRNEKRERREAEAAAKFDERYFQGNPCSRGHTLPVPQQQPMRRVFEGVAAEICQDSPEG